MKATINSSKKFLTCSIRQISSDFSTVKVLRYTINNIAIKTMGGGAVDNVGVTSDLLASSTEPGG